MVYDYQDWMEKFDRRKRNLKRIGIGFIGTVIFIAGMGTHYLAKKEPLEMGKACLERETASLMLSSMPEPSEKHKAEARRNVKRVTTEYLTKRKVSN